MAEKESWVVKLKRKSHELLKGEKAYISKKRYAEMKTARKAKKGKSVLKQYSEESQKPSFRGASGSDLAELKKRFGKKGG